MQRSSTRTKDEDEHEHGPGKPGANMEYVCGRSCDRLSLNLTDFSAPALRRWLEHPCVSDPYDGNVRNKGAATSTGGIWRKLSRTKKPPVNCREFVKPGLTGLGPEVARVFPILSRDRTGLRLWRRLQEK